MMEKAEYKKEYILENKNWWYVSKRKLVLKNIRKYLPKRKNLKILDVGCGTGIVLKMLEKYGTVYGIDIDDQAIHFCKKRELNNIKKANIENIPYKDNYFDIITCLDVLYHEKVNDKKALCEFHRILKKDGIIIVNDVAFNFLKSKHDIVYHARQRYTKKELNEKITKAGFNVVKSTYWNFFLFLPVAFVRLSRKLFINKNEDISKIKSDINDIPETMNFFLLNLLKLERYLLNYTTLPFGISIMTVAKK